LAEEYRSTSDSEAEAKKSGASAVTYPAQVGNFKLEGNLEFRFPVYKFLNGAVFGDLGNIWLIGREQADVDPESYFRFDRFYDQLALNTGIGARMDFGFFLFRIDWGLRLHVPNKPSGQKWIRKLTLRQSAFSFSVGYPF
jgi:outer membrane protein assembly factor BamA